MSWLTRLLPSIRSNAQKKDIPEGLWHKCNGCQAILYLTDLERNLSVCPKCGHHMRITARKRLQQFLDMDSWTELGGDILPVDHLKFRDSKKYKDRLVAAHKATGEQEAIIVLQGSLLGMPVVACAFEFDFIGGSMSSAVGERIVRAIHFSMQNQMPLICFSASGGARMQEGLISLFQMAKTSAALAKLSKKAVPYVSVLTNPTMGGVSASVAMLGDIIIAEPKAVIGFSGPRVIEQTIRHSLPEGFQTSEFLLEHGMIDMVVDRRQLRPKIADLLFKLCKKDPKQNNSKNN